MIALRDVSATLGDTWVLEGIDLDVSRGRFVGLVGPNGAGKTTLLRTINGLVEPATGVVTVDGESVASLPARAVSRRVATLPQETSLSFAFDVRDVVAMGRTPHRSRFERASESDRAHVRRALCRTRIAHLADRSIDEVSGGERQRVLLARALCQDTPVLLLDEPTASLDIGHGVYTLELVRDLVAEGKTAIAAIHDLDLAARFCDDLALLADGQVLAAGPPEGVLTEETLETAFGVATVVSSNPITGARSVVARTNRPERDARVHVLGGGCAGAAVVGRCWRAGFGVSVGPIPEGDIAAERARTLGIDVVTAPPFDAPPETARRTTTDLVRAADAAVPVAGAVPPLLDTLVAESDTVVVVEPAAGSETESPPRALVGGQATRDERDGRQASADPDATGRSADHETSAARANRRPPTGPLDRAAERDRAERWSAARVTTEAGVVETIEAALTERANG